MDVRLREIAWDVRPVDIHVGGRVMGVRLVDIHVEIAWDVRPVDIHVETA